MGSGPLGLKLRPGGCSFSGGGRFPAIAKGRNAHLLTSWWLSTSSNDAYDVRSGLVPPPSIHHCEVLGLTRTTDDFLHNSTTPTTRNWIIYRARSIARVITTHRTITSRANIVQHRNLLAYLYTHLSNTTRTPPIPWPIPTDIIYRAFWIDNTLSGEQHPHVKWYGTS